MTTRNDLRTDLRFRLNESAASVWTDNELDSYLNFAIKALYPTYYQYRVATTTAGVGPLQPSPVTCRHIYQIGHVRSGATRVRGVRGWTEGDGSAIVPKLGISGQTLVWSWTAGYDAPASGTATLSIPLEAEEPTIIRSQITALERVVTDRSKAAKYFAVQVREGVTEQDILDAIDALHQTLKEHREKARPLPEVVR